MSSTIFFASFLSAEIHGSESLLSYSKLFIGGVDPGELIVTSNGNGYNGNSGSGGIMDTMHHGNMASGAPAFMGN